MSIILAGFPDLYSLERIISWYNARQLTYNRDALPALSGLLAIISRSFTGGFLYGLPEMYFDRALGWAPMQVTRREDSTEVSNHRQPFSALPSWSWIGWQGRVEFGPGEARQVRPWLEETIPITIWYTSTSPTGSLLRRVRSTWYENRNSFKDFTRPLPKGWTRHNVEPGDMADQEPRLWPEGCGTEISKHRNMPEGHDYIWFYPFPVPDIDETTPFFTPDQTPYLFCETQRAYLWAHRPDTSTILHLREHPSAANIGSLQLHNDDQLDQFPEPDSDKSKPQGRIVELVAIYQSRIVSNTWNQEKKRNYLPQYVVEEYQVLWIEWSNEVAYRLAIGAVRRACWEALDLEDISLVLG